jgi:hypothetical protein
VPTTKLPTLERHVHTPPASPWGSAHLVYDQNVDVFLLLAALAGGVFLALVLTRIIYRAVSNGLDYLIETFGNERAAEEIRRKREQRPAKDR